MKKIVCEQEFDSILTEFLNGLKPHSKNAYSPLFKYWINFSGMNGKETLEFRKADKDALTQKKVLAFKAWLIEKGKSENFATLGSSAIRGFLASHRLKLEFTRSETKTLQETNRSTQDYLFTKEDLAKMSEQASLTERYVLLVGKSVGLREGDFLTFTYGDFRSIHIEGEAPISLGEVVTQKEHIPAYPFLDSDAVQIVKAFLERTPDAKDSDKVLDWDEQSLTQCLQRLFEKAHLVAGEKRVRFHNLRKYLIDRLSAVASESQWKQIVGKKIAEGAYISTDQLRDVYLRAMPSIVINGNGKTHVKIEELEKALAQAEDERRTETTRREQTEKRLDEVLKILAKRQVNFEEHKFESGKVVFPSKEAMKKHIEETKRENEILREFLSEG
jgi:hypothetical protein